MSQHIGEGVQWVQGGKRLEQPYISDIQKFKRIVNTLSKVKALTQEVIAYVAAMWG